MRVEMQILCSRGWHLTPGSLMTTTSIYMHKHTHIYKRAHTYTHSFRLTDYVWSSFIGLGRLSLIVIGARRLRWEQLIVSLGHWCDSHVTEYVWRYSSPDVSVWGMLEWRNWLVEPVRERNREKICLCVYDCIRWILVSLMVDDNTRT